MSRRSPRRLLAAVAVLLTLIAAVAGQQRVPPRDRGASDPPRGTAIIRGRVIAAATGAPLRRAEVVVSAQAPGGSHGTAETDGDGRFEIAQLAAASYTISARRSGYVTSTFGEVEPGRPGTPFDLGEGQVVEDMRFALLRGATISGRVVDEFGEPIVARLVMAYRYSNTDGVRRLTAAGYGGGASDTTDDLGQFRLFGLAPGEYFVGLSRGGPSDVMASGHGTRETYPPTYFPGTTTPTDAGRIVVAAGQDVTDVSFALVPTRLGRVSGRVTTSRGQPFRGMVRLGPSGDDAGDARLGGVSVTIRANGTFETTGLIPGRYSLTVDEIESGTESDETVHMAVDVRADEVSDVVVVTGPGGTIRGRVVVDDGSALTLTPMQVHVSLRPRHPSRSVSLTQPTRIGDGWEFEIKGLAEMVSLSVMYIGLPGQWVARHAWKNGADLLDTVLNLGHGQTIDDVELVLSRKVTELSGVVSDRRDQPAPNARIVVFPEDRAQWTYNSRYVRVTRSDANGRFSVRLTPHGAYRALVVRGSEEGEFPVPEFLARALDYATSFQIRDGETKVLNLKLAELK